MKPRISPIGSGKSFAAIRKEIAALGGLGTKQNPLVVTSTSATTLPMVEINIILRTVSYRGPGSVSLGMKQP